MGATSSQRPILDAAGRRRSPATLPGYHKERTPRNRAMKYPPDPPTVDELIAVMRQLGDDRHGRRLKALIVVLWRAGLRIQEALMLAETDLNLRRGSVLVRKGKGSRRRRSESTPGRSSSSPHGYAIAPSYRSDRCSASSTDQHANGPGRHPPYAASCVTQLPSPVCVAA